MSFAAGVLALLLVATVMLLWRRDLGPRAADQKNENVRWYEQRRSEIAALPADNESTLLEEARLRLLEDGAGHPMQDAATLRGRRFPVLPMLVVVSCVAGAIYLQTGSIEDVLIYRELAAITPEDGEPRRRALLQRIEARSRAREDNLQYLSLLGQLYMAAEDFAGADEVFGKLAEKSPEDPQALAMAAQARFLAVGRKFDAESQLLAERALAVDPTQRTALGLLGMASFESGAFVAAVSYWERLRDLEPTGSEAYEMLDGVIKAAQERGGLQVADEETTETTETTNATAAPGISVALSLPGNASVDPDATVFIFARSAAAAGGMPIAVRRLQAAELPLTLRLVDADAMAGQRLSEAGSVRVTAQISANGQPGAANALFEGASDPVEAGDNGVTVEIQLRPAAGNASSGA